ncbi:hypothetical protein PNP59_09475 [Halobacterium salinarum]|nr:hypothetical protein [Halobacterium salinarum]MDL0131161.1 hypothetical protein [Halobacterium salinarum]
MTPPAPTTHSLPSGSRATAQPAVATAVRPAAGDSVSRRRPGSL